MALSLSSSAIVSAQVQKKLNIKSTISLQNVRNLVKTIGVPSIVSSPKESLQNGNWVKLICGASFEDVVDIRNLSLVYTLAGGLCKAVTGLCKALISPTGIKMKLQERGLDLIQQVDCIDCAADASVVSAVNEGINIAREIAPLRRPWVMISVNDDEDLHFRKAEFDPEDCPVDCARPCEKVCPAGAITLVGDKLTSELSHDNNELDAFKGGVLTERCYGCGRCFPVCPYDKIREVTYIRDAKATAELIKRDDVEALEIHTSGRLTSPFQELWNGLGDSIRHLRLVAVSLPDIGETTLSSMKDIYSVMEPSLNCLNLWQLDGRPMSGDIGRGATKESIAFAVRLAAIKEKPKGFLQLAGGTNAHTVDGLKKVGLFQSTASTRDGKLGSKIPVSHALIGGVAYGGYARKIVGRILNSMQKESQMSVPHIEEYPDYLLQALNDALALVGTVKPYELKH